MADRVPVGPPLSRACPHCSSVPGQRCRDPQGRTVPTHSARWRESRHGATQPESERGTVRVVLRLTPEERESLELVRRPGEPLSRCVGRIAGYRLRRGCQSPALHGAAGECDCDCDERASGVPGANRRDPRK